MRNGQACVRVHVRVCSWILHFIHCFCCGLLLQWIVKRWLLGNVVCDKPAKIPFDPCMYCMCDASCYHRGALQGSQWWRGSVLADEWIWTISSNTCTRQLESLTQQQCLQHNRFTCKYWHVHLCGIFYSVREVCLSFASVWLNTCEEYILYNWLSDDWFID